ncbi:MAG: DNA mismatch repair endonuclease MutL [Gammaproteobacteria bacterium]
MSSDNTRIRRLPDVLINRIAAGEVIERPASVVKELVENSLDAGANAIRIDLEGDGTALIRVSDDGTGMAREDLALAVARHATSKIAELDDIVRLGTLGFRGEALASIASVCRFALISAAGSQGGWRIDVDAGVAREVQPAPRARGTTIEVRELFASVPARRKFLRSPRTEVHHVQEVVRRLALAHPRVSFRLAHDGRVLVQAGAGEPPPRRLARICGRGFAQGALAVQARAGDMALAGWVAPAQAARNQSDLQYLALNARPIRDAAVQRAVRRAFGEEFPPGLHPAFVLALTLDPRTFDVNVHPAKAEVRFRDLRAVHDFVLSAVREALGRGAAGSPPDFEHAMAHAPAAANAHGVEPAHTTAPGDWRVHSPWALYRDAAPAPAPGAPQAVSQAPEPAVDRVLAVCGDRYVLCARGEAIVAVDARAARAAMALARMRQGLAADGALRSRPLLVPATARWSGAPEAIPALAARLAPFAVVLEALGPREIVLRGIPAAIAFAAGRDVLEWLCRCPLPDDADAVLVGLAQAACAAPLEQAAAADLLAQWRQARAAGLDPAGCERVIDAGRLAQLFAERE